MYPARQVSPHLPRAHVGEAGLEQVALGEPGQPEVRLRDARVVAVTIDDEVGDEPPDGRRDLETVPAEARGDHQSLERTGGDDRIPVRGHVVTPGVTTGDGRVGELREAGTDLVDGQIQERLVGTIEVVVGVGDLQLGEIAVAEQDLTADIGPHVLQ